MDKVINIPKETPAVNSSRIFLSRTTRRRYLLFLLLVAPAFLLRLTTAAYPILQTIYLGFTNLDILKGTNDFIGLGNYLSMSSNIGVRSATGFTLIFILTTTVLDLIIGMLIALLLNSNFRGLPFARTINLIPWAIPTIVAGYHAPDMAKPSCAWCLENLRWNSSATGRTPDRLRKRLLPRLAKKPAARAV